MAEDVLRVRLTADGIQEIMAALKKVQTGTEKVAAAGKSSVDALGALGTIFAAGQIAGFAKGAIDAADGLFKMSQKTGVAVEGLSVLTYMGQQADLSNQDLEKGLVKLAKSLTELDAGAGPATEAFSRLGLTAADFKGLSLDQALVKISNAQAKFADGAGKADLALALMGKSGANMIPLMNDLANGGFENAKKKLQDLGLVLSGDMAKSSQDFNDSMKRLEMAAQGATVQIAQGVLPGLTKAVDGLTTTLAGMPMGAKAFAGSFLLVGSAATAAAVAIRTVGTALMGLGPISIAAVALAALAAGLMAWEASQEAAHQQDLRDIATKGKMVQQGDKLVDQYRREAQALEKAGNNRKEAAKHAAKLKEIEGKLIEISPAYLQILKDETKGIKEKAQAMNDLDVAQKLALETQLAQLKVDRARLAEAVQMGEAAKPQELQGEGGLALPGAVDITPALKEKLRVADETIAALERSLGIAKPDVAKPKEDKKTLDALDAAKRKATAAAEAAEAKRLADETKAELESYSALTEDLYKRGLIDLTTYEAARRTAIEQSTANEIALLNAQVQAEIAGRAKGATPAEKIASETKVADLRAQINLKQQQGQEQLNALERKGRDEREKDTEAALKAEADLAAAKGRTGEAGIKAIEAEYEKRIQLAKTEQERVALRGLKGSAIATARLGDATKDVERGQAALGLGLGQIDNQQAQGLITEEDAVRRKIALYQEFIPVLEKVAAVQLELARATGNPDDLLKAQQNADGVEALKGNLKQLGDSLAYVKNAARDAFQTGLAELLMSIGDQTTSLTEKFKKLGQAILNAIAQAMAMRAATAITTWAFGAVGKADGGLILGPGTATSDSIPLMGSNGEYMMKAAAVQYYGPGFFQALNGMRVPRFASGGPIGSVPAEPFRSAPVVGEINITVTSQGRAEVSGDGAGMLTARRLKDAVIGIVLDASRPGGELARG